MRHDADTRRIFVDEHVIGTSMRTLGEDVTRLRGRGLDREQAGDNGGLEPVRERRVEQPILDEIGRPRLESPVGELLPPRLGSSSDLPRR